jgi:hypothetical protein
LSTVSLGPITFGNQAVMPSNGQTNFTTDVDLRPGQNLLVRIIANLDTNTGLFTWGLTSIDPATGNIPLDPTNGFLPPDLNPPQGDGSVMFSVKPKQGLVAGTQIANQASIVFDANAAIATPVWINTLAGSPGPPTGVTATAGNASATVSFTPPAPNGGGAVTGYAVTSYPAGGIDVNAGTTSTTHTVTGLTNGITYTFTVTATNGIGTSGPSSPSNSITPRPPFGKVPGAPAGVRARAGNALATVSFKLPSNGGSPITGCTVTSKPGGVAYTGAGSPITVPGLTNGAAYTFRVTATNTVGTGKASEPSNKVTPATIPGAPVAVTAEAGNADAKVSFSAPASNGGSHITSYTVTSSSGQRGKGAKSPITVEHLTNGDSYTFTVTARNKIGTGPASSSSNSVTPTK